jgi:hypothetical protein
MMLKKQFTTFMFAAIIALTSVFAVNAQSSKAKSMAEEIKKEFPYREGQVAEKCDNAKIPFDVDFASFGDNTTALLSVPQLGLKETANAFRRFCTDSNNTSSFDKVKVSALKSKVKKIQLKHVDSASAKKVSLLSDGTVLIEMKFDEPTAGGINYVAMADRLSEIL